MTFAWESENWDRDREERLEGQRRYTEQVKVFTGPAEVSLGEWLDSRALYVNSHPQVLTRNQQERVIWKSAKEEQAGNETPESKGLREWLQSRERNAAVARKAAINLTAAFSRSTFVPDPSTPPFLSRTSFAATNDVSSNMPSHIVSPSVSSDMTKKLAEPKPEPIRLTGGQLFLAVSRLVLQVNWDWFHANRHNFDMSNISSETSQRWWNDICQVYDQYCKAAAQGADALMKLYQQSKSGDHVLNMEQTILNPMLRFLVGYKADEGRSGGVVKAVLEALLLEGKDDH